MYQISCFATPKRQFSILSLGSGLDASKILNKTKANSGKTQLELVLLNLYKLWSEVGRICLAGTAQPVLKNQRGKSSTKTTPGKILTTCVSLLSESPTLGFPPQFFHCPTQPTRAMTKAPLPASSVGIPIPFALFPSHLWLSGSLGG